MSDTLFKVIYDCETKEEVIIPLTEEEVAELRELQSQQEAQRAEFEAEQAAKQAARESAIAKLAALGLSAEEAAAIVGG